METALELWLIRHGETDWNHQGRIQGQLDQPLNAAGRDQVARLAARLAGQHFQAVYASDLARALETAQMLARRLHGQPTVQPDVRWREQLLGVAQGLTHAELLAKGIEWPRSYREAFTGGESRLELMQRVRAPLEELFAAHRSGRVIVVSHGATLSATVRVLIGDETYKLKLYGHDNTGITRFWLHTAHAGTLMSLNDSAHLERQTVSVSADETELDSSQDMVAPVMLS